VSIRAPRSARALVALTSVTLVAGCGGPRELSSKVVVEVETTPPGAMVTLSDASGRRALGRAPLTHEVEYVETVYESTPTWWIMTAASAVVAGLGAALVMGGAGSELRDSGGAIVRDTTDSTMIGTGIALAALGGTTFFVGLPLAIVDTSLADDVLWSSPRHGPTAYEADLPGYRGASQVLATSAERPWSVRLVLAEDASASASAPVLGGLADAPNVAEGSVLSGAGGLGTRGALPFVAVFEVEDRSRVTDAATIAALTDQLATQLVERRAFRVVPAADLRARLAEAKKASYQACVDERCQIELGKAVAADRTLSARILRVGEGCTINGVVYDLKTEATERAASVRGGCTPEALVAGIERLAAKLAED